MSITPLDTRAELARDGVSIVRSVLDERWLHHLREAVEHALAHPSPLGHELSLSGGRFHSDLFLSTSFPAFFEFALRSGLACLAAEWMGVERVILYTDELLVKEPGTEQETPWHADASYWPLEGEAMVSVWLPLDPVDVANGALHIGTSTRRDRPHRLPERQRAGPIGVGEEPVEIGRPGALEADDDERIAKGRLAKLWLPFEEAIKTDPHRQP